MSDPTDNKRAPRRRGIGRLAFAAATAIAASVAIVGVSSLGAEAATWPAARSTTTLTSTKPISGNVDGGLVRYKAGGAMGNGGQSESQKPLLELADGATLRNVIIGSPAADGIHCKGSCTLINVWWEDVGEDAATFKGGGSARYTVDGGAARSASDKVFQHNGGGTLTVKNFEVSNFGKLYRSCGNCSTQHKRTVVFQNVTAVAPGSELAGVNANYGDTATFSRITVVGRNNMTICTRYTGNNTGSEPRKIGSGADGTHCRYAASDITFR